MSDNATTAPNFDEAQLSAAHYAPPKQLQPHSAQHLRDRGVSTARELSGAQRQGPVRVAFVEVTRQALKIEDGEEKEKRKRLAAAALCSRTKERGCGRVCVWSGEKERSREGGRVRAMDEGERFDSVQT